VQESPTCGQYRDVGNHLLATSAVYRYYRAERAISGDGSTYWGVASDAFELHTEACAYLVGLRSDDRACNIQGTYAGRITLHLSYCTENAVDWSRPSLAQLLS
jgi:hypothetical protein